MLDFLRAKPLHCSNIFTFVKNPLHCQNFSTKPHSVKKKLQSGSSQHKVRQNSLRFPKIFCATEQMVESQAQSEAFRWHCGLCFILLCSCCVDLLIICFYFCLFWLGAVCVWCVWEGGRIMCSRISHPHVCPSFHKVVPLTTNSRQRWLSPTWFYPR